MPYSTIDKPSKYFNTLTWTGNGSSRNITGTGFDPNFVWIKNRSNGTRYHVLNDKVRGANKQLFSNVTNSEESDTNQLTAFITDGFSLGTNANVNTNGDLYVSWNWLANGTGVSNTAGTISSTVSANTTSGFSIVSWTGAGASGTVGHGLGAVPKFIITKKRNNTGNWACYHVSLGNTQYIYLNTTGASATYSGFWNNTTPTSTLISLGTDDNVTGNGDSIIAYCFAEVKGYSKAFSYTGNGSSDGTYVHLGFRPAFVMTKASSTTGNWKISWNSFTNGNDYNLAPNLSGAEGNANQIDLLSNGFKCRATDTDRNGSGTTYIGFAFAENPFVSSKGIPCTAR